MAKKVCVVGAGIAGLATAKVLTADGFDVTVFEKEQALGGVWAVTRAYPGLRANNTRDTYAFSDHPYPSTADDYPNAEQVRAYLDSYVDRFRIRARIRLSTEVESISGAPAGADPAGFNVIVRPAGSSQAPETLPFDYLAICNGVFSEPRMPEITARERFAGAVLHSSQVTYPETISGKRVVVVGAGKSALDCANWAGRTAEACTLVFRTPHWMGPRYAFGIRSDYFVMTRVAELFIPYHRQGRFQAFLHGPGKPLTRLFWRGMSRLFRSLLSIPPELVPASPLPAGAENLGVGGECYEALREGRITAKHARVLSFAGPSALELDTGERLECDVIICATGWRQGAPFLAPELLSRIRNHDGSFLLYRHILPPEEPQIGFVGYASSTACQLTSEVAAHWLSQHFRGEMALPSVAEMKAEIAKVLRWTAEVFPACRQGYFVGPCVAHYIDDLLRDMGLKTRRTSNFLTEYFAMLSPARYQEVGEERRRMRALPKAALPPAAECQNA